MLYVTTRSRKDAFTTPRAIASDRAQDGGLYLPFRIPTYEPAEMQALGERSFGQNVAIVLNQFFSCRLSGWDVEFAVGRYPAKLQSLGHRLVIGEVWHNLESDYACLERNLAQLISGVMENGQISSWTKIAIRIAVLFGVFGELQKKGLADISQSMDIAVATGDFLTPITAWYARKMGLPIANIICCCNENSAVWDLLTHGQVRTDCQKTATNTPLSDVALPEELERLISGCLGECGLVRYLAVCEEGGTYTPRPEELRLLRDGLAATVVSDSRVEVMISHTHRSTGYILGPYTALAYAGLTDYRAKTGESRQTLILSRRSPVLDAEVVCGAMRISEETLLEMLQQQ